MAVDLASLSSASSTATSLANLILVKPKSDIGIQAMPNPGTTSENAPDSFLFHYEGENVVTLESDITDHMAEDNTALQDQISLKPELIQTHGYIGELNDVVPPLLQPLKTAADKLLILSPFVPKVSATALIAFNTAAQAYATTALVLGAAVSAWGSIVGGEPVQTKQQAAYSKFYGYWKDRQLFMVQTPWAIFDNMAIKTLRAVQDEDTRMISSFEITFKKMRFAQTVTLGPTTSFNGRLGDQAASRKDLGVNPPVPDVGLASRLA